MSRVLSRRFTKGLAGAFGRQQRIEEKLGIALTRIEEVLDWRF